MGYTKDLFLQYRQEEVTRDKKREAGYINNYFTKPIKINEATNFQNKGQRGK